MGQIGRNHRQSTYDKDRTRRSGRARENHVAGYIDGNTVRKLEPRRIPEEAPRKAPARKPNHEVRKNRDKASHMNAGYVLFLAAALCAAALILVNYIQLQSDLTNLTRNVADRQSQLNSLKLLNDEEYNRIVSSIDLEEIKRVAMGELGMVYAQEGQIVEYEGKKTDYMRKVSDNQR